MWRDLLACLGTVIIVAGCASHGPTRTPVSGPSPGRAEVSQSRDGLTTPAAESGEPNPLALAAYAGEPDFELRNLSQRPINIAVHLAGPSSGRDVVVELGPGRTYEPAFWKWEQYPTQVRLSLAGEDPVVVPAPAGQRFDVTVESEHLVVRKR